MHRVLARVGLVLGVVSMLAAAGAPAAFGQTAPIVWFEDSFCSGTLANWTPSPLGLTQNWSASTGRAVYNGGGHTQLYAGAMTWTDYTVEARFRLENGNNYPGGLRGRVNTTTGESYAAWTFPFTIDSLLDKAVGPEGYYAVLTANIHTDKAANLHESESIVASALARGVPVVTSRQMLRWLDGRNGSSFANIEKTGASLSFTVNAGTGADGLQALLPIASATGTLSTLTRGGTLVSFTTQTIKGVEYAVFSAVAGAYQATYSAP